MTRKSKREIESSLEDLAVSDDVDDVSLTDEQAAAIREYDLNCDSLADLDDSARAAVLEVAT